MYTVGNAMFLPRAFMKDARHTATVSRCPDLARLGELSVVERSEGDNPTKTIMKLTAAFVTALSAGEVAHGFVVPSAPLGVSSPSSRAATGSLPSNTCGVSMKAEDGSGMATTQSMDRRQMLQSAAFAFGAALVTANPSTSFAATSVDYSKVCYGRIDKIC